MCRRGSALTARTPDRVCYRASGLSVDLPSGSELISQAQEHLTRVAVESGQRPLAAQRRDELAGWVGQQRSSGRIRGQEGVTRGLVFLVEQVLSVQADAPHVIIRTKDEA